MEIDEKISRLAESKGNFSNDWVATVILESNDKWNNNYRMKVLTQIVDSILKRTTGDGVILFPGGWFSADEEEAKVLYNWVEKNIKNILIKIQRNVKVCLGIDGRLTKDQIGICISKHGIEAIGRKFYPAPGEMDVELAHDHLSQEEGKSRIFELNGKKFFICACYDSFGIKKKDIPNFGIDVILDLVHVFYSEGDGSGDAYFAKFGFAGVSKHWNCHVFGAVVFLNRNIPENWPSGVYWSQGNKRTKKWRYQDNPIKPRTEFNLKIKEGIASVRIFNIEII